MHLPRTTVLLAAAVAALSASVWAAPAAERSMIVLDGSGSMWGRIDGEPKLQIARRTLGEVLPQLPAGAEIGLLAYGHREKGNCEDIELVVPPAPGTAAAIAQAAGSMRFLGKTPLSAAVRQAAEALRYTEDKATVILITDGIETCSADPCALATELEQAGVDFTAHVVGFGLTRDEGRQVACLADLTGGRYLEAKNAKELTDALGSTVVVAADPKPEETQAPKPAVQAPPASITGPKTATIGGMVRVDWQGPAAKGDYIDIVPPGFAQTANELAYAWTDHGNPALLRAPGKPGEYEIRYVWAGGVGRKALATDTLTVAEGEAFLDAPQSVAAGDDLEIAWTGPDTNGDYVDLVPADHTETAGELAYFYTGNGNPGRLRAPGEAGSYKLRYVLQAPDGRRVLVESPIAVTKARATLAFPPTAPVGSLVPVNWTGPKGSGHYIDLVPAGYTETGGELAYAYVESSRDGETSTLRMPAQPGDYQIRYVLEAPTGRRVLASEAIELTAATATLAAPDSVAAGEDIAVTWSGPDGDGDYLDIVPSGQQEASGELAYSYTANADGEVGGERISTLRAPDQPGTYDLRYILQAAGGRAVLARRSLIVR